MKKHGLIRRGFRTKDQEVSIRDGRTVATLHYPCDIIESRERALDETRQTNVGLVLGNTDTDAVVLCAFSERDTHRTQLSTANKKQTEAQPPILTSCRVSDCLEMTRLERVEGRT